MRLKGKINNMAEKITKLKKRKRELKRMLPSGSGEQGKFCCCKTEKKGTIVTMLRNENEMNLQYQENN